MKQLITIHTLSSNFLINKYSQSTQLLQMKKIFIFLLLSSAIIFTTPIKVSAQSTEQIFAFSCQPFLQNLHQNGITISWMVNLNSTSCVEYGETEKLGMRAIHSQSGIIDVGSGIQKVVLNNLKPGTHYYYNVVSKELKLHQAYKVVYGDSLRSKIYSFTTPSANVQNFSFLAFNDIHSLPKFTEEVVKRESGFQFVMLNGDILNDINEESDIYNFMLKPFSSYFASDKPFFFTRGNHETRGAGASSLAKYIDTPTGAYYYSFTYGNTHFVVLDCGEDKSDNHIKYFGLADYDNYRSQEALWLAKEVLTPEFKNAKFRVVCIHMPINLSKDGTQVNGHGMNDSSEKFATILNNAKVDLLLCGHTHSKYSIVRPKKGINNFPIIIGGGPFKDNPIYKTTYTLVEINKNILTATLKLADGNVIDKVIVKSLKLK